MILVLLIKSLVMNKLIVTSMIICLPSLSLQQSLRHLLFQDIAFNVAGLISFSVGGVASHDLLFGRVGRFDNRDQVGANHSMEGNKGIRTWRLFLSFRHSRFAFLHSSRYIEAEVGFSFAESNVLDVALTGSLVSARMNHLET